MANSVEASRSRRGCFAVSGAPPWHVRLLPSAVVGCSIRRMPSRSNERNLHRDIWLGRFNSTTPSTPTSATSPAPHTQRPRDVSAPDQAIRPARGPVDPRRDHRRRRVREQRAPRHPRRQPTQAGAVLRAVRRTRAAGQHRAVRVPRSASRDVLRRLGPRRDRDRRDPALGRRPRPTQPRPFRPCRRARDPKRGVPHAVGPDNVRFHNSGVK
jgi:hypothetical protein